MVSPVEEMVLLERARQMDRQEGKSYYYEYMVVGCVEAAKNCERIMRLLMAAATRAVDDDDLVTPKDMLDIILDEIGTLHMRAEKARAREPIEGYPHYSEDIEWRKEHQDG